MAFVNTRARLIVARCLCLLTLAVYAGACASAPKGPPVGAEQPDKFLFDRGTELLEERRWLRAREFFRQLIDSYPQSPYRADGKLGLGDTYLGERTTESQILAINEYKEFLSFYPTSKRADYAQLKLGLAHYYQMRGPARDQTETRAAIAELTTFVQRYPASPLIEEGRKRLREAKDRLGDHEYGVAVFYYRSRMSIPGALDRFNSVLKADPEYYRRDGVYWHMAQILVQLRQPAAAIPYLDKLVSEFEQSEYLVQAREQLVTLKAEMDALIKK